MKIKLRNILFKIKYLDLKYIIGEKFLRKLINFIRWIIGELEFEVWVGVIGGEVFVYFF